jgi:hypothetical protein
MADINTKYTKEYIEDQLNDILYDCLASSNQEGTIESLTYDPKTKKVTVVFEEISIVPEDDYVGFAGY